jgi:hypothetical protein
VGSLSILNVYQGDVKISFDTENPAEAIRARRIIKDMMKRGYALLVEVDGKYQRALEFDETKGEYIIADFDSDATAEPVLRAKNYIAAEEENIVEEQSSEEKEQDKKGKRGKGRRGLRLESTTAVAIARSAGG